MKRNVAPQAGRELQDLVSWNGVVGKLIDRVQRSGAIGRPAA